VTAEEVKPPSRKQPVWLIYFSLLVAGLLLLGDALNIPHFHRWTLKLGVALVYSAVCLFIGNGRKAGFIAVILVWLAVIATLFI